MNPFDLAFELIIGVEGGYSNDPDDPGGETKFGISKRAHPNIDIKNLTLEGAKIIYRDEYWNVAQCDRIPAPVAILVFDCAVNSGPITAVKFLQAAVGVAPDGVIGADTIRRIRSFDLLELMSLFMADRAIAYTEISGFHKYGRGWLKRIFKILAITWSSKL